MKFKKKMFTEFKGILSLKDSRYVYDDGYGWKATTLIAAAKKAKLETFKVDLKSISIHHLPFTISDAYDFIVHCQRVNKTNLKYPVIMLETGQIADGWHRIIKATLAGKRYIDAVRFIDNPPFDIVPKDKK
jgi:disulfide oxidoreductase YuzD